MTRRMYGIDNDRIGYLMPDGGRVRGASHRAAVWATAAEAWAAASAVAATHYESRYDEVVPILRNLEYIQPHE